MNTDTTADSQAEPTADAATDAADDPRIIVDWFPKRPGLNYIGAFVLFIFAGVIFQDYILNPEVHGTEMTGIIATLFFLVVMLRLLIGATSQKRTILDLDNVTLTVLTKRLGMKKKRVYRARDFSEVRLRQPKPPEDEEAHVLNNAPITLSLYSYDQDLEIKCFQGLSPGELREMAEIIAEIFDVKFDNEILDPRGINIFWPE